MCVQKKTKIIIILKHSFLRIIFFKTILNAYKCFYLLFVLNFTSFNLLLGKIYFNRDLSLNLQYI